MIDVTLSCDYTETETIQKVYSVLVLPLFIIHTADSALKGLW